MHEIKHALIAFKFIVLEPTAWTEFAGSHHSAPPRDAVALWNRHFDLNAIADFRSDAVIDEANLNLHQELVRSNPNETEAPIKKFEGLVLGEDAPKYKHKKKVNKHVCK